MATANKNLSQYDSGKLPSTRGLRFGIIVAQWNTEITESLFKGARDTLIDNGVAAEDILRWEAPGSFELVYTAALMQKSAEVDAIIALGSVIQGETRHFDFICNATANGIKDLNAKGEIPVIFGVLTDNTYQQALDRSGGKHGNKGVECAIAAIQMADLYRRNR